MQKNEIEPLLDPENERLSVFPIKYPEIWDMYKDQQGAYWKREEIDFESDRDDFETYDPDEQHFIKMVLALFVSFDGLVNLNLKDRFLKEVKVTEALITYSWQMMMENIHGEVYSEMLEKIIKDPGERDFLFKSIETIPVIKMISDWAKKWIDSADSFAHRLVAFAAVEGIVFSGAFAAIFWLKKYRSGGKDKMKGLVASNRFISRDEGLHCKFACLLYSMLKYSKLEQEEVYKIIDEAVEVSKMFNKDVIRCELIGMNFTLMSQYIEFVGDTLLSMLGYEPKYAVSNPFENLMEPIGLLNKKNFHEGRPTDYKMAHTSTNVARSEINLIDDF